MNAAGKAILFCVDDDPKSLQWLESLFVPRGYELRLIQNGEEVLSRVETEIPDLILLDSGMPGLSGLEVLRKLKANDRTRLIPVVLLTTSSEPEDRIRGIEAGCDDFIPKPLEEHELLTRVRALLKISFYRRALDEKEKFEVVLEEMGDGVVVCHPDGVITNMNRSAKIYFDIREGFNFVEHIFEQYSVSIERADLLDFSVMRRSFDIKREETEKFKPLYLETNMDVIKTPSGEVSSLVMVFRDVTRERNEDFMAQDFLALIAHKFNTPITVVREALSLVKEEVKNEANKKLLRAAESKILDIHNLSQRLIFVLEAQSRGLKESLSAFVVRNRIAAAQERLDRLYGIKSIVEREIAVSHASLWKIISMEELIENAYRFRSAAALHIRIILTENSVEVTDNGVGIPAEEQKKIFEPFYQVYKYFHGNIPGLGLGLTLVKKLTEMNHGKIEVESHIDKGTRFKIIFS